MYAIVIFHLSLIKDVAHCITVARYGIVNESIVSDVSAEAGMIVSSSSLKTNGKTVQVRRYQYNSAPILSKSTQRSSVNTR